MPRDTAARGRFARITAGRRCRLPPLGHEANEVEPPRAGAEHSDLNHDDVPRVSVLQSRPLADM